MSEKQQRSQGTTAAQQKTDGTGEQLVDLRPVAAASVAGEGAEFALSQYLRLKSIWRRRRERPNQFPVELSNPDSRPYSGVRDPRALGSVFQRIVQEMGWAEKLDEAAVIADWAAIVGPENAKHTRIIDIANGVMRVQCDDTNWATNLRVFRADIVTKITAAHPKSGITDIKFIPPSGPSWQHGPLRVPGRGPRDTYG